MILEKFRIDGKVVIVTGGTRGIGLAIADALGAGGAKLVVTSRTNKFGGLESLQQKGYDVSFYQCDMTDKSVPQEIINYTLKKHGSIDILVNNAGVAQHGEMEEFTDELLDKIMNTNVDALFRMCRSVITPMRKQGSGVILNIGSVSGLISNIPQPQVAYNASKAAVHMLTKSLASDFANENIRVNAIAPGYCRTEMTNLPKEHEEWYQIWSDMTPLNRMAETHEIGPAALFLCSPASSYITGEVLVVDGGYTSR
jgi:NAD(P)-dependent dehydrogenase (short-subunit alcohol dehydrogenase family)